MKKPIGVQSLVWGLVLLGGLSLGACDKSEHAAPPADLDQTEEEAPADGDTDTDNPTADGDYDLDTTHPASHSDNKGGVWHMPGRETARTTCTGCHGADLNGEYGPSCYTCHTGENHSLSLDGTKHMPKPVASCAVCHADNGQGLAASCARCHGVESLSPPSSHSDQQGTAKHKPGKNDALATCTTCHGAALKGAFGPACTSCHTTADHTDIRDGVAHRPGAASTCSACHGPDNTGGLGTACSTCHSGSTHPASHTDQQGSAWHLPGKANPLAACTSCHGADLKGGEAKSCYTCHSTADHTRFTGTAPHREGTIASCAACHGPDNAGGLGRACSSCHGKDTSVAPTSHTDLQGTAKHLTGKEDALKNCVVCHGSNLRGALARGCYSCHSATNHTISRDGYMHRSGGSSTCTPCHGPNNSGSLAQACTPCHLAHGDKN